MPPLPTCTVLVPPAPRHGAEGRDAALRVARLLAAQDFGVTLVTEVLPPGWPALAALCPGRPLPRCLGALPPEPLDWLLLAAPVVPEEVLTRPPCRRLALLEVRPGDWPLPVLAALGGGLLLSPAAPGALPPGWRHEAWPPALPPEAAAPLLADLLLRGTAAVAPRPMAATLPGPVPPPPVALRAARVSGGGALLLTLDCPWPEVPESLRAHSPGGPELPLVRQPGAPILHLLAPAGLLGHAVVLTATGQQRRRFPVEAAAPATPAACTIDQDQEADGWRLLRGTLAAPATALLFSPDGARWLEATVTPPQVTLEYRPQPQDTPAATRMLLLDEAGALALLTGWPPRPGRHQAGHATFGIGSGLQAVAAGLAARLPGLCAVLAEHPDDLAALGILPPAIARLPLDEARAAAWAGTAALAAEVALLPDPLLAAAGPVLALDGIGAPAALLARAVAAALPLAEAAGLRLAVVVDAPPLEPLPALRARLGLPEAVLPMWPQGLARGTVRALADLGLGQGVPAAVALARGIPAGLWAQLAPPGAARPWPRLPLPGILALPPPGAEAGGAVPYAALEALLAEAGGP